MTTWADRVAIRGETSRRFEERLRESVSRTIAGGPEAIARRLEELDREWDIERALAMWAPFPLAAGLALGAFVDRRWLVLPAAVAATLALHATWGWCPPVSGLRRLGVRTRAEIDQERFALKALRGDFQVTQGVDTVLADVLQ